MYVWNVLNIIMIPCWSVCCYASQRGSAGHSHRCTESSRSPGSEPDEYQSKINPASACNQEWIIPEGPGEALDSWVSVAVKPLAEISWKCEELENTLLCVISIWNLWTKRWPPGWQKSREKPPSAEPSQFVFSVSLKSKEIWERENEFNVLLNGEIWAKVSQQRVLTDDWCRTGP